MRLMRPVSLSFRVLVIGGAAWALGCASDDTGDTTPVGGRVSMGGSLSGAGGAFPGTDLQTGATGGQPAGAADVGPLVPSPPDAAPTAPPGPGQDAVVPLADAGPPAGDAATPAGDAARPPPPGPDLGTGYVSCAEAPGQPAECFSNSDCPGDRVCRNIGASDFEVPCCVPGARGQLPGGSPCEPAVGETTCASSICIEGSTGAFCSTTCQQAADCPVGMQVCQFIAFSSSEEMWCFPETPE